MSDRKWIPFFFESNESWGLADTREKWQEIKDVFINAHGSMDLDKIKQCNPIKNTSYYFIFGTGSGCDKDYSLQEFSENNDLYL